MPWPEIATQVGIPVEHEASTDDLQAMFNVAIGALAVDEQREFDQWPGAMVPQDKAPVETIASLVLSSMYEAFPAVPHCDKLFWHMAQSHEFWLTAPVEPPPNIIQINCGGLGGGTLSSPTTPTINCTHPRVNGTCVYGPSLTPADRSHVQSA